MKQLVRKAARAVPAVIVVLVIALAILGLAVPAFAIYTMPLPDVQPQLLDANAYSGCLVDGDLGVLLEYSIAYTVLPALIASEAYTFAFIAADNTTQLTASTPYVYIDSGYTMTSGAPSGAVWMYFTPAEVTAHGLSAVSIASYGIWIIGNPTVTWGGVAPLVKGALNSWVSTSPKTQLGLKILNYADVFGTFWSLALSQVSPTGTVLTASGEQYFQTTIPNLRSMCPQIFASGSVSPIPPYITYASGFGATFTNLTGTAAGSPITLVSGVNNINITAGGAFTAALAKGTTGTATSDVAVVAGSPVTLVAGDNTVTVAGAGNIKVTVAVSNTQSRLWAPIAGTVFDMTPLANLFGVSVMFASGMAWLLITIIICASVYGGIKDPNNPYNDSSGKVVMLIFDVCFIGGAVLGMLSLLIAILMFVGFGLLTGYVLFFRNSGA